VRILSVIGELSQFIDAAMVSREFVLTRSPGDTPPHGQHFDDHMSRAFFQELGMPRPDCHLGIHRPCRGGGAEL
jgi:hypothetical protein